MASLCNEGDLTLTSPTGSAKGDAHNLAENVSAVAKDHILQVVKCMIDLDALFLQSKLEFLAQEAKLEFLAQEASYDRFCALALEYKPIRNEAVSVVVSLKNFAGNATTTLIPLLLTALESGNVANAKAAIDELVESFQRVSSKLRKLMAKHNEVIATVRQLLDQVVNIAGEKAQVADAATYACKVIAVFAGLATLGTMLFVGSRRADWLYLGLGGVVEVACGLKWAREDQTSQRFHALEESARRINNRTSLLTAKLEREHVALDELVYKLRGSTDSTQKIQTLVNAWSENGTGRIQTQEFRVKPWLERKIPRDMAEMSRHCVELLDAVGNEAPAVELLDAEERACMISAMNDGVTVPCQSRTQMLTYAHRV